MITTLTYPFRFYMASSIRPKTSFFSKKIIATIVLATLFLVLPLFVSIYEVVNSRLPDEIADSNFDPNATPQDTDIRAIFASYDYDLIDIRKGHTPVPKLFLSSLPENLDEISNTNERKKIFISIILYVITRIKHVNGVFSRSVIELFPECFTYAFPGGHFLGD